MMTFGVSSGVGGFVSGRLVKHVPLYLIVYGNSANFLVLLLFLLFWKPSPIHPALFVLAAVIGVCEGCFNSISSSTLCVYVYIYESPLPMKAEDKNMSENELIDN